MINNVVLTGRLTNAVELRYTPNGNAVANFTLAVNRKFKTDGQPEADFVQCVVWNQSAETMANYTDKGSLIGVEGRLQTRFYDTDERRVYVTEVVLESFTFLESKKEEEKPAKKQNQRNAGNSRQKR
jgi:single-strand DNA-binding protein